MTAKRPRVAGDGEFHLGLRVLAGQAGEGLGIADTRARGGGQGATDHAQQQPDQRPAGPGPPVRRAPFEHESQKDGQSRRDTRNP
jgi:hypothetical protein